MNDSKKDLGTRVDRHEHIGKGFIGLEGFRLILNDKSFEKIPKILETPKEDDWDKKNLATLRRLYKGWGYENQKNNRSVILRFSFGSV